MSSSSAAILSPLPPLPCAELMTRQALVMLLFEAVAALRKTGDHRNQQGQGAEGFEHFEEGPSTQPVRQPRPTPFNRVQRNQPPVFQSGQVMVPRFGTNSPFKDLHIGLPEPPGHEP
jgi:hypothetical protein